MNVKMLIVLSEGEKAALMRNARDERRDPRQQAAWLIRQQLERLGLLQPAPTIPQKESAREHA